MRAIRRDGYGSPDILELKDVDKPVPKDDEVLVRVQASSLNMADLDYLRGRPRVARVGTGIGSPRSKGLGLDVAGRVEATGRGVKGLQPGDDV